MSIVIVHPAPEAADGWDAYIEGRPPIRVATMRELNAEIATLATVEAPVPVVELIGIPGCVTAAECPYAATMAVLHADPCTWIIRHACDDHQPPRHDDLFGEVHIIRGGTAARHGSQRARLPDVYRKDSPADTAAIVAALAGHDVPPSILRQPRCRTCKKRLMPQAGLHLAWVTSAGPAERCRRGGDHEPAGSDVVAMIRRYNDEAIEHLHDPAAEAAAS